MIDIAQQTTCKICGEPIVQKDSSSRGHRKRNYCSDRCKQVAYRQRKKQPQVVTIVTIEEQGYQARIAALEQEIQTLKMLAGRRTRRKERVGLQHRFMTTGQATGYQAVTIRVTTGQGVDAWRSFAKDASEDMLARAIVAAGGS